MAKQAGLHDGVARSSKHKKEDHHIYFDPWSIRKMDEYLANNTTERGSLSRSGLVRRALKRYFNDEDSYWPMVFIRLDRLTAKMNSYSKRMHVLTNVVMHFLAYYFLNWPDLSPEEKEESAVKSDTMVAKFEDSLKRKLLVGGYLQELELDDIKDLIIENTKILKLELEAQAEEEKQHQRPQTATKPKDGPPKHKP